MIKVLNSFIAKLSKREKVIFYVTIFVVFSLVVTRFLFNPAVLRIEALDKETSEQEETIKKNLLLLSRENEIKKEYDKYSPYFEKSETKSIEPISFLKSIENLAQNASVELLDIKPSPLQEGELTKEYFVTLTCEAPMDSIFDFLYSIENSEQLLSVERMTVAPKEEVSDIVRCNIYISKVFIMPTESNKEEGS
ncbi:MAG: GspMb/PilO family protein [Candidatus Ratteibacteria bacterium]|nr:GspMb/PilO family protein [Candidatus Ratteibacteria bacterium]